MVQNRFHYLIRARTLKRVTTGHGFIADNAERENIGGRRQCFQFDLLGRHVEQCPFLRAGGVGVRHVSDAEIDDLHRVVFHHENIARLQIAVYQSAFVRRLQAAAGLGHDVNRALDREPMAGLADERLQRGAREQRHHEVGLLFAILFEFPDVEDLDNVGMAHRCQHVALFVEQLKRSRIGNVEDGLDRYFAAHDGVVGPVHQAHTTLAEDLPHFVAACQFSG